MSYELSTTRKSLSKQIDKLHWLLYENQDELKKAIELAFGLEVISIDAENDEIVFNDDEEALGHREFDTRPIPVLSVQVNSYQLLDKLLDSFNCSTREGCAEVILDTCCFDDQDELAQFQLLLPHAPVDDWIKYDYIIFYK